MWADLSVDLRDVVGDRLYLSNGFRRDGVLAFHPFYDFLLTPFQTLFDIGHATLLQEHTQALSVRQAIAQSRKSRGFLDTILRRESLPFKPTYNYRPDGSACRIFGTVTVKKVTGIRFFPFRVIYMPTPPLASQLARHNSRARLY